MNEKTKMSDRISVIVPNNPFIPEGLQEKRHCLCAIDVDELMDLWPGTPHRPNPDPSKVKAIQRSLDWKRVAHIAAYLLQEEIIDAPQKLDQYFSPIYEPKKNEPGREWPPKVNKVITFQPSEFPIFSNVLIHVNGAKIEDLEGVKGIGDLVYQNNDPKLILSVIDGQHRVNGAYFALCIRREKDKAAKWQIPAEIFLDLDPEGKTSMQAQIFIDVNFNQKKVDRSLVADLYPTARSFRETFGNKERAQDIGRRLMLETGPLVGMIQIPGIKYGVKDVVTLATLNGAIENILDDLVKQDITNLETQTDFIAQCLTGWLEASGRFENKIQKKKVELNPENVVYQGRILVSVIALIPGMIWKLKKEKPKLKLLSEKSLDVLTKWLRDVAKRANMLDGNIFIDKKKFKERGYLGSGGIGRFRDSLWVVITGKNKLTIRTNPEKIAQLAKNNRDLVWSELQKI